MIQSEFRSLREARRAQSPSEAVADIGRCTWRWALFEMRENAQHVQGLRDFIPEGWAELCTREKETKARENEAKARGDVRSKKEAVRDKKVVRKKV